LEKIKSEILSWIKAIGIAVIIAIIIRTFLFTNYVVDGPSMMPTLQNNNQLIVNKLVYDLGQPQYGDIIIFHATPTQDFVKRVIGLPGDTIVYKNDQLYRNGKKIPEPYLNVYKKQLTSGEFTNDFSLIKLTGKLKVPKGKLWVMGDNRPISEDSRMIGFIDENKVVGKVSLRYFPFSEITYFNNKT
jgi:signal peptidase I